MAIFTKYNSFIDELAAGGHNLKTAVFKCALTNTAPNQASDAIFSAPPPAAVNGYPSGGATLTTTGAATSGGLFRLKLADTVFTASGAGGIGPFRYVILYNSSAANKLCGYYDYSASISLADTDTFTVDFDDTNGVLTLA
jgi:hypothetical protein